MDKQQDQVKQQLQRKKELLEQIRDAYRQEHERVNAEMERQESPADDKVNARLAEAYQAYREHHQRQYA